MFFNLISKSIEISIFYMMTLQYPYHIILKITLQQWPVRDPISCRQPFVDTNFILKSVHGNGLRLFGPRHFPFSNYICRAPDMALIGTIFIVFRLWRDVRRCWKLRHFSSNLSCSWLQQRDLSLYFDMNLLKSKHTEVFSILLLPHSILRENVRTSEKII